ncbi:MAG: sulfurtransferase-like selenium metabolism protein YedF [Candidatus Obscuribacterales bacterium]|nr:sulfurtransferase-like selenium metabolism protein YedF [Candidatus Obscuribacterales bacterium]
MTEKIDLRGLTCPEPVIRTKKLFDDPSINSVHALVDDDICVSNLQRLASSLKADFSSTQLDGHFSVQIARNGSNDKHANVTPATTPVKEAPASKGQAPQTVVFITKDRLGEGDPDFSRTLLDVFLQTMYEAGHRPRAILLANSGVKLMASDSAAAKVLEDFRQVGTEVLACGLCVKFYGLVDQIRQEQITNMFAICEYVGAADKVITP